MPLLICRLIVRRFVSLILICGCLRSIALLAEQAKAIPNPAAQIVNFIDIAEKAGLTAPNVFGGIDTKKYIIETTGNGVAIFDYDNDGWPDIFLVNGTRLAGLPSGRRRRIIFIATITTELSPT
jgi:hypothetical protein